MLFMLVVAVHVTSCVLLIVAVLLQSGKDAGLSGAFGLGGGGQTIFGARAGDVLGKVTIVLAVTFIVSCLLFTRLRPAGGRSIVGAVGEEAAPAAAAVPPAPEAPAGAAGEAGGDAG
ncbi:MAG: preprotein translocase subunit SecG [bacterium]|nr:preprotein translocase subunit SecG [bacterium]